MTEPDHKSEERAQEGNDEDRTSAPRSDESVTPPPEASADEPDTNDTAEQPHDRRRALKTFVAAGGAAYACSLAVPAARFLAPAAQGPRGEASFLRVAPLQSLPESVPVQVKVRGDQRDAYTITRNQTLGSVWLQRKGDKVTAMSAECPHLGCAISLGPDKKDFRCPCHTSRFSLEGSADDGPSPRGMDSLEARVVEGWVEVAFVRFRQGITSKEALG